MASPPLQSYMGRLTEAEKEIFTHGMNFQMYIMDIRREIMKLRHKGDEVAFFTMIHREFAVDIEEHFKTHMREIQVKIEKVPEDQGEPYVSEYVIMGFKE